jgi:signal transduction histidine kinase
MFFKLIDTFIPEEYKKSGETWRKARLAVGTYTIITIYSFTYSVINFGVEFWGGFYSQFPLFVITSLCLFLYKKNVQPIIVAFIFFTEAIISISTAIYYSGGFNSFVLPWLATTPIVALLVSGKKMGAYTLVAQSIMLCIFTYLEYTGVQTSELQTSEIPLILVFSGYLGLIILFFVIGVIFENGKSTAMDMLKDKNDELQNAFTQLKNTQGQLVQQEKLASLGQLTAGISHELKNPLNFVNNFSELSIELVDEARQELRQASADGGKESEGNDADTSGEPSFILDILDDIESNLKTIHKHGSRADSIIKSMLQHSRGSGVIMEPTKLNPLLKEFVNLSFHGMRAGDQPIEVDIEFDLDPSIGEVPIIAEDFSRVMVNLCNNAFDAMREKVRKNNNGTYIPKLFIRTVEKDQIINIVVEDNGVGIPENLRKKILQPFFTTKKGTEGTGLGLYITSDIIKAHGGLLHIQSEENKFTRFIIELNRKR